MKHVILILLILIFTPLISKAESVTYIVKKGDTLGSIAKKHYDGDEYSWPYIYQANRDKLQGASLNNPPAGIEIIVPDKNEMKEAIGCKIHKKELCIVTGQETYAPFSGENLPNGGMITEIVKKVFESLGYKVTIMYISGWDKVMDETKEIKYAATFPWLKNKEREKYFLYSSSLYDTLVVPFYRTGKTPFRGRKSDKFENLNDLEGLTLCKPIGYYTHDIDELILTGKIQLKRPETLEDCFKMLIVGDVDIVTESIIVGRKMMMSNPNFHEKISYETESIISEESNYVIFPKLSARSEILRYKFNQTIKKLEETGELEKIQYEHLKNYFDE